MELSIGIPTYNAREYLGKCLTSINDHLSGVEYEVIVVDDVSDDGTEEMVKKEFSEVTYLKNQKRSGPSGATNIAIKKSQGDYFLRLDVDTEVIPGSVEKLIKFLQEHPKAGAVGAGLVSKTGERQKSTHEGEFLPIFWFHEFNFIFTKLLKRIAGVVIRGNDKPRKVFGMGTGAVLVRREVLEQKIYLDPNIPFFMEDSDWFVRMQKEGWEVWYYPEAKIIHVGGSSSGDYYIHMTDIALSGLYKYYNKHHSEEGKRGRLSRAIITGTSLNLLLSLFLYLPSRFHPWTKKVINTSLRSSLNVLKWFLRKDI